MLNVEYLVKYSNQGTWKPYLVKIDIFNKRYNNLAPNRNPRWSVQLQNMWQFQWPLQQGVVQLNTHMLAGFCISTQEGRLPPVDVETTIQDVAEYNKFHTSHWSVKIDLSLLDVLGLPSPVALWIKEENFLRFLWSLHHKIEIGGKRPTIPQFISPNFLHFVSPVLFST